ncbi:MAG: hypothetical protein AAF741_01790 [Bacteroidota bacterium]
MKVLLSILLLAISQNLIQAALVGPGAEVEQIEAESNPTEPMLTLDDLRTMRNRDLREHLRRRLTLGESLVFGLIRGKLKRQDRREARRARKNARRAERGLPPLEYEVDKTVSWLALGSLSIFTLITLSAIFSTISPVAFLLWLFSLIGMLIFGGQGRRKYRGVDNGAFTTSNIVFWLGLVFSAAIITVLIGLFVWLG